MKITMRLSRVLLWAGVLTAGMGVACNDKSAGSGGEKDAFAEGKAASPGNFSLTGTFANCPGDSMRLYTVDGTILKQLMVAPIEQKGQSAVFSMQGELPGAGFYFVGTTPQNVRNLLLGGENGVKISGNCASLTQGSVVSSPANDLMLKVGARISASQNQMSALMRQLMQQGARPSPETSAKMKEMYQDQRKLVDSLKRVQPVVGKIFALTLVPPFDPFNNPKKYADVIEHFAAEFGAEADLSDPAYNYLPSLSDNMSVYIQNIYGGGMAEEKANQYLDRMLARIPAGTQAHKSAFTGALRTLDQMRSASMGRFAEAYSKHFPDDPNTAYYAEAAKRHNAFAGGASVPEIALPNPNGKTVKLSDLRGKVVMIDFWASWCGPCRRENPNVVRLYQKYKNKGFEILGVSLDRAKDQWVQAIQQDNLTWVHVSDLKFWQSQAAQDYGVDAIPKTFLLDRQGKLIAKDLRGPALEAKLKEIFGS